MRSLNPRGRKVQGSSLLALFPALLPALLLASLIVVSSTAPAMAFTPRTRSEIVRRAMTLMPDALQRQMRRHSRALFEGTLTPSGVEGEAEHALDPGSADRALQQAVARLVSRVDTQQPMREVVRELGRVAHSATDLAFALNIGEDDLREAQIYASFGRYVEKMLPKIAVTFDGFVRQ
ncbi:MAG: hypothetical protein JSV80_15685 [Acidobacteriota bacterium]|nr:MAG: hypothetical protein JSV80_15685 [Acidobacteriota bacterium]